MSFATPHATPTFFGGSGVVAIRINDITFNFSKLKRKPGISHQNLKQLGKKTASQSRIKCSYHVVFIETIRERKSVDVELGNHVYQRLYLRRARDLFVRDGAAGVRSVLRVLLLSSPLVPVVPHRCATQGENDVSQRRNRRRMDDVGKSTMTCLTFAIEAHRCMKNCR